MFPKPRFPAPDDVPQCAQAIKCGIMSLVSTEVDEALIIRWSNSVQRLAQTASKSSNQ